VSIASPYYEDVIRVFDSSLKVTDVGHLSTKVNRIKIKVKHANWFTMGNPKYQGKKIIIFKHS